MRPDFVALPQPIVGIALQLLNRYINLAAKGTMSEKLLELSSGVVVI
jgi:hypothetical protein